MRLIDSDGSFTINATDTTGYSLAFGGGIISCADEFGHIEAEFFADDIPIVDAVPVVYCKDCKYADKERRNAIERRYVNGILFCRNSGLCGDEPFAMWPNDFCSYGERKGREDDEIG